MEKLVINPKNIDKIVISHEHWDHTGGLKALKSLVEDAELYRLENKNPSENMNLISVEEPKIITKGVYTTGRLRGSIDEQSLVLKGKKGWYVLVGCSHPGVEKILYAAGQIGEIIGIIGGFHDFNSFIVIQNLDFICPCHCTKYKEDIKKLYPDLCTSCGVGQTITI